MLAGAVLLAMGSAALVGCVRKDVHEATLAELDRARSDAAQKDARIGALERAAADLERKVQELETKLSDETTSNADLGRKVDDLLVLNAELSSRLKAAGQNVEQLAAERGNLAHTLADTRARLEELKKQQAQADARGAQYRELVNRFQKLIDGGKLAVTIRQGRMLLEMPNDLLFDGTKTTLKPDGRAVVRDVAKVLKTMPDRAFQVAAHTDGVKAQGAKHAPTWELAAARAVEIVKVLVDAGLDPHALSAASYAEFAPAATNDTAEGRARNRRVEITLVPTPDEMIRVPGASESPAPPKTPPPAAAPAPRPSAATPPQPGSGAAPPRSAAIQR